MFVSQISIFLENVRGSLRNMTELLGEKGINLLALTIDETRGFGIIRVIVKSEDIDSTLSVLHLGGYIAKTNKVIGVRVPHKPMGLAKVMAALDDAGISIEYSYSFYRSNFEEACIIIRPSDIEGGISALQKAGINILSQTEIDAI